MNDKMFAPCILPAHSCSEMNVFHRSLLELLLSLLCVLSSVRGVLGVEVLCRGADGHVSVGYGCDDCDDCPEESSAPSGVVIDSTDARDCTDVVLKAVSFRIPFTKYAPPPAPVVVPAPFPSGFFEPALSSPTARRGLSPGRFSLPSAPDLLRSVVLVI